MAPSVCVCVLSYSLQGEGETHANEAEIFYLTD